MGFGTWMGAVVLLALGVAGCNRAGETRARQETAGEEVTAREAHLEMEEVKAKPGERAEGEWKTKPGDRAEEMGEETEERSHEVPENEWYRGYNVLDEGNTTP